jgi:hypothetical protein
MRLSDEFEVRECFDLEPGCPTLTVVLDEGESMLPWSRFESGEYTDSRIDLFFGEKTVVVIEGESLRKIWEAVQLQDLRQVRLSRESDNGQSQVTSLMVDSQDDEGTEEPL